MRPCWTILLLAVCFGVGVVLLPAAIAQEAGTAPATEAVPETLKPAPPPVEPVAPDFDFEAGVPANWTVAGEGAALQVTQLRQNVADGQGALECAYVPMCTISVGGLIPQPNARSLRFSLKTTEPTNLTYSVRETDGSEYQSFCYVPGGAWQQIALNLNELVLAQGSDDENGQIDPDQITGITIGDLANLPGEVGEALGQKIGQQMLWLDDVKLSPDPAPSRAGAAGLAGLVLDTFDAPQVNCLAIGGAKLAPTPAGLQATYSLGAGRWVGLVTAAGQLDLAHAGSVKMRVKAPQATSLVVVLEERDGTKYETRLELPGGDTWEDLTFPIANFILDDDSQDENGALDLAQIRVVIALADMLTSGVDVLGKGSLVIDEIAFQAQ